MRRVVTLLLLLSSAARADVDVTGTWGLNFGPSSPIPVSSPFDAYLTIVQHGTQLTAALEQDDEPVDPTQVAFPFTGTIDPSSGELSLEDTTQNLNCAGPVISGVADGAAGTMTGSYQSPTHMGTRPCIAETHAITAVRLPCGNRQLDDGEACDDGNRFDGDCCAGDCRVARADGATCDDDDVCTTTDRCEAGRCAAGPPLDCGPCQVCGASGCELPALACAPALTGEASLRLRAKPAKPGKQKLAWRWRSSRSVFEDDLGNPLDATGYALCLIDHANGAPALRTTARVPASGRCGGKACWKASRTGFVYESRAGAADGLRALRLTRGPAGEATIRVRGSGPQLAVPTDGLVPPVTVRLVRDDAPVCWEATFSTPKVNGGVRFRATSD